MIASVFLVTMNLIEGGCVGVILLVLGLFAAGVLSKYLPAEAPGYYYILPAAILTGFVSTRGCFLRRVFFVMNPWRSAYWRT